MSNRMFSNTEIDHLLSLYISGEMETGDLRVLREFVEQSEQNRSYVQERLEILFSSSALYNTVGVDKQKAYQRFKNRVLAQHQVKKSGSRFVWGRMYIAAAVVLLLLLPLFGFWWGSQSVKSSFAEIVVEAPLGARTKMNLPDGSVVWLNAGSTLSYSQGYGVDGRNLKLDGEGYFEVEKNEKLPFIVSTREIDLCVRGTKFNFRNYESDDEAEVNLLEGKVELNNRIHSDEVLVLQPNERMVMDKDTGKWEKCTAEAGHSNLWTKDELFFDEDLITDIARKLSRTFDVHIEVDDSLKDERFYGSFKIVGNNIYEVLTEMSFTGRMAFRKEGEIYKLYKK